MRLTLIRTSQTDGMRNAGRCCSSRLQTGEEKMQRSRTNSNAEHIWLEKKNKQTKKAVLFCGLIQFMWALLFWSRCQCPAQFEGPECQQNKHSFHGNGYAWFPPMMPCFESHISLEFITEVADGLLLYSGPLAQLQAWDQEDFMAIGKRLFPSGFILLECESCNYTV